MNERHSSVALYFVMPFALSESLLRLESADSLLQTFLPQITTTKQNLSDTGYWNNNSEW